jgi:outer membrane receptor protein involved in Fe transport
MAVPATAGAGLAPADPTLLPLEELVETEVITAARFARRISDAPSAASVMTAEDIRLHGFRTLAQILDHMRGVFLTYSPNYVFVGARGYGGSEVFAGRVLLLIDGVTAADSIYDQIYLGDDSLVDPALIDRIEYAPGTGSAMYGRNALVGVIHVITKRGRDLQGVQASAGLAQFGERNARLSAGRREADGMEWLASLSVGRNDGRSAPELGDLAGGGDASASWNRWLLKARRGNWSVQSMGVLRRHRTADPVGQYSGTESNRVLMLTHDAQAAPHLTASMRLSLGDYRLSSRQTVAPSLGLDARILGRWWSAESLWIFDGLVGHRIVAALDFRHDFRQQASLEDPSQQISESNALRRRSVGLSIEDEVALGADCRATLGLRMDRRVGATGRGNPRAALACDLDGSWTAKLSHGRATRFPSRAEEGLFGESPFRPESIATTEAVLEGRREALRWAASVYRYRLDRASDLATLDDRVTGQGAEVELEWQRGGWRLRGSQSWQSLHDSVGVRRDFSPRTTTKLLASAPLDGERLRLGLTVRSVGGYRRALETWTPRRTQLDLAVQWRPSRSDWEWSAGVRNLFDARYRDVEDYFVPPSSVADRSSRTLWLSVVWRWQ